MNRLTKEYSCVKKIISRIIIIIDGVKLDKGSSACKCYLLLSMMIHDLHRLRVSNVTIQNYIPLDDYARSLIHRTIIIGGGK